MMNRKKEMEEQLGFLKLPFMLEQYRSLAAEAANKNSPKLLSFIPYNSQDFTKDVSLMGLTISIISLINELKKR